MELVAAVQFVFREAPCKGSWLDRSTGASESNRSQCSNVSVMASHIWVAGHCWVTLQTE